MTAHGRLAGHKAIVTGSSRGIGLAIAREFAREGADLLLVATREGTLAAARQELLSLGGRVETLAADLGQRENCELAVDRGIEHFGHVDILVNCAAIYQAASFLDHSAEDFERLLQINLHGPVHTMRRVLPHMRERGYGRIINVASTAGKWASKNQSAYNISKHAVIGLTRCTALEFASHGITINALCPGMVQTDLSDQFLREHAMAAGTTPETFHSDTLKRIPVGRFLDPSECGHLAVYLASPEARGMTGQSVLLDGGMLFV